MFYTTNGLVTLSPQFSVYRMILHSSNTAQKMKFSTEDLFCKLQETADLVTFSEEILNGKLHFLSSVRQEAYIGMTTNIMYVYLHNFAAPGALKKYIFIV